MGATVLAWAELIRLDVGRPRLPHGPGPTRMADSLVVWAVACVAMMIPPAWPAVRHVATNSLRWRRGRAVAEFLVAYLGVWVASGAVVLMALRPAAGLLPDHVMLSAALGGAAAWLLLPFQRRALRACHRTVPLPPRGWRAAAGAARFGLRHGWACVGVCGPLMVVMAVAGHGSVVAMPATSLAVAGLRLLPGRSAVSEVLAAVLSGAAVIALIS